MGEMDNWVEIEIDKDRDNREGEKCFKNILLLSKVYFLFNFIFFY